MELQEFLEAAKDCSLPYSQLYRINKKNEIEQGSIFVRIYNLFDMNIKDFTLRDLKLFAKGYRSAMSRIARTSYCELDKSLSEYTPEDRGYRFAWLCHHYCRKYGIHEYPELSIEVK